MSSDVVDGPLPESATPLVVRTDFSDEPGWLALAGEIGDEVQASADLVTFVADAAYRGASARRLVGLVPGGSRQPVLMLADEVTFSGDEHQLLMVDLLDEPGRTFRTTAEAVSTVVNNLVIANLGFADYADTVDGDGVYRLSERFKQVMAEMRAAMVSRPTGSPQARIAGPRMAARGQRATPARPTIAGRAGRPMTRGVPSRPVGETTGAAGEAPADPGETPNNAGETTTNSGEIPGNSGETTNE